MRGRKRKKRCPTRKRSRRCKSFRLLDMSSTLRRLSENRQLSAGRQPHRPKLAQKFARELMRLGLVQLACRVLYGGA